MSFETLDVCVRALNIRLFYIITTVQYNIVTTVILCKVEQNHVWHLMGLILFPFDIKG